MEDLRNQKNPNLILLISICFIIFNLSSAFRPSDNYLIDCGSTVETTIENRVFVGDSNAESFVLAATPEISIRDHNPSPYSSPLYHTARVFTKPSSYEFDVNTKGTHVVRLHFYPFFSRDYNLSSATFHVWVSGVVLLLKDFNLQQNNETPLLKEYLIKVDSEKLVINFTPSRRSSFAFVNAIEVISAPGDLIADTARLLTAKKIEDYHGLSKQALETVHRINVGGPKITPFNDSLWRTWIPDDNYLQLSSASKRVAFGGRINFREGGASREIAPDFVYNSARAMNDGNVPVPNFNITWVFPVNDGYRYLVRLHFCDIVSLALNELYFNVYINGYLAYEDLDISDSADQVLASPYYVDFIVDAGCSGVLNVSVGPSKLTSPLRINAILNGVEIMKMNNSMGSLDGEFSADLVLESWPEGNFGVLARCVLGGFAFMSLLMAGFTFLAKRRNEVKDSVVWSPLPVDSLDDNSTPPSSGKSSGYF
eukprot:TRINITY_DN1606_c0_g1_i1.p1 TRINITY_DN1606_c0_g1~~TRINITY_DN1606_c0_g1_i1.p1  ORF type:complete len:482 (+),score=46.87 TRINITY_DN1606_c0_g1_i1:108-1553(+)